MLHRVPEALKQDVGPLDETDPTAGGGRQVDDVAPQGSAVVREVLEDEVDRLAEVVRRTALGAAPAQRSFEGLDGFLDVADLVTLLLLRRGGRRVGRSGLGLEAQRVAQFVEQAVGGSR